MGSFAVMPSTVGMTTQFMYLASSKQQLTMARRDLEHSEFGKRGDESEPVVDVRINVVHDDPGLSWHKNSLALPQMPPSVPVIIATLLSK